MRRRAVLLGFLLCAGCGDDERVGPREPAGTPPPPAAAPADARDAWAGTRVGDWATWEIRVEGSDAKTLLTWRATKAEGARVEYDVTSRTTAPDGRVIASQEIRSVHAGSFDAVRRRGTATRPFAVGDRRVTAVESEMAGPLGTVSVWTSPDVPFHGLVYSKVAGVEQTLVAFERAP